MQSTAGGLCEFSHNIESSLAIVEYCIFYVSSRSRPPIEFCEDYMKPFIVLDLNCSISYFYIREVRPCLNEDCVKIAYSRCEIAK